MNALNICHPWWMVRDTAIYINLRPPWRKSKLPSLKLLVKHWLGEEFHVGTHDSVHDAIAALRLYHVHRNEWELSVHCYLSSCLHILPTAPPVQAYTVSSKENVTHIIAKEEAHVVSLKEPKAHGIEKEDVPEVSNMGALAQRSSPEVNPEEVSGPVGTDE